MPEILHGSGYQQQNYEAGLVGAFSLALLQALNGHNTPNPIGCLQHEKLYRTQGIYEGFGNPRYLRADLFLDIAKLYVANKRLSQYGWRHEAWLEAKFLRNQAGANGNFHSTNKTAHSAAFLADLIRLVALVEEQDPQSKTARYFLHVYDAEPKYYLPTRNNPWIKSITTPGEQNLRISNLDEKSQTLRNLLGDLGAISINAKVTNLVLNPITTEYRPVYYCYLTRIDSFICSVGNDQFSLTSSRTIASQPVGAASRTAAYVAERLHIKPNSPEQEMPVEAEQQSEDDAINNNEP